MEPELAKAEAELDAVEASLARIEARTYGRCEICQAMLDDELLALDPTARRCPAHPKK